jgi:Transposase DDE domain
MHVKEILHELLSSAIHKTRMKTLEVLLTGLIHSKGLKLTLLGRSLPTSGKERSAILRVDRFLRNRFFQNQSIKLYECITLYVIGSNQHPNILVDWSSLPNSHYITKNGEHCVLRASLAAEGRAITLYEEVHPKTLEGHPKVHDLFLKNLHSILPKGCVPCVITDAGFKTPWFKKVLALGWDYVGRVACGTSCFDDGEGFASVRDLFELAIQAPKFIGSYSLTKSNRLKTNFYIYKGTPKGRHKWTKTAPKKIAKDKDSRKHGKSYREPWVLVSSFEGDNNAKKVIDKYKSRMTIEENIRDTKSVHYGLSMNENLTIKPERYIVWLMLAALASLIAWIVGFFAEQKKLHLDFQANTYKHRRVLSFFYLGCQIIRKKIPLHVDFKEIIALAWVNST